MVQVRDSQLEGDLHPQEDNKYIEGNEYSKEKIVIEKVTKN